MYRSILVPVDLAHADALEKALATAADLAKAYDAELTYLGVTTTTPSTIARTPEGYDAKLEAFAAADGAKRGITPKAVTIASTDLTIELNSSLVEMVAELGADLVVMASHMPGVADHVFTGHAPYVATHAPVSVMVVR